ncbi:MAG TPA: CDP-alcohol phosphatidyltransferase family protein [Anaerolineales bacterium]|nr:CDP-alcohol phosphatidyltransferase family protein [Anaerolineales bacterium]HRF47368.1 CDP-alcohol phosphatidyltransferase family protein [Anaerolineales bacterium]
MQTDKPVKPATVTDWFRVTFKGVLDPIADFFNRLGIHPNTMTVAGLVFNAVGAFFIAQGSMILGGVFILIGGPFDALDGTMARRLNQPTRFGAFVDSVTDRWSEMLILLGLAYFYATGDDPNGWLYVVLVFLATMGSVMVSYTKSRAESLGFTANVGVMTRLERYLIMAPCLLFNVPWVALWILAIFANFTALQRTWHVRRQAYSKKEE